MENDIVLAPAGYMFMYLSAMALFAWNFYRVLRNRPQQVQVDARDRDDSRGQQPVSSSYSDSRRAA